jgi:hypothetical protein
VAELLLINPAEPIRRKGSKMAKSKTSRKRKWGSPAQRAALKKMLAANRRKGGGSKRRAAKRTSASAARRRMANPVTASYSRKRRGARRRSNPISLGGASGVIGALKTALLGGAGSVAVDLAYGQVARFLPVMLQRTPGSVGLGDAVKAVFTVAAGELLNKPTRGMSRKMAAGALTVQAATILRNFVPASLALGYYNPAAVTQGTARVGPIRPGMNAYVPGAPPLLNAYSEGLPPMLNGMPGSMSSAMAREGVTRFR